MLFVCCVIVLCRIDKNQDMKIDWVEWRDYFDLRSAESLEDILKLWRCPPVRIAVHFINPECLLLRCLIFCFINKCVMWYSAYLHLYTMSVENNRDVICVKAKAFTYEANATKICH